LRRTLDSGVEKWSHEYRFLYPCGQYRSVLDRGFIVRDETDTPRRVIGAISDITDHLRTERVMRDAERLAAMGTLAAGIAHELNNPLTAIVNFSEIAQRAAQTDSQTLAKALGTIQREAMRCGEIVRNVLRFSRQPISEKAPHDLDDVVRQVGVLTEKLAVDNGVDVRFELAPELPRVIANSGEIAQVLLNLVVNAIQACERGDTVTVITRKGEHTVEMAVQDTGRGIEPQYLSHIFDPFFTTRHKDGGTGLGMSVSYGIIRQHGGTIDVASTVGVGTTVTVTLPRELSQGHGI